MEDPVVVNQEPDEAQALAYARGVVLYGATRLAQVIERQLLEALAYLERPESGQCPGLAKRLERLSRVHLGYLGLLADMTGLLEPGRWPVVLSPEEDQDG